MSVHLACACMCVHVCACMCMCMCVHVCACMCMCMCVCRQLYVGKLSNDFRGPQTGNFQMTLEGHYITPKSVPQTHIGRMVRLAESRGRGGYISIQPMILSHVLRFAYYFPYLLYLFVLKGVTLEHKVLYTVCHLFTKYNLPNFL